MALTQFAQQLKQLHDMLITPNAPGVRGMELIANNQDQLVLIRDALNASGCTYTVIVGSGAEPKFMVSVIGSKAQLRACVETLLGY